MKVRTSLLALAFCLVAVVCFAASNAAIGTWKLDESKSKMGAGSTKNSTVVYEEAGDNIKCTIDGTSSDGKPLHTEWTGKFDGKLYPVTGDANSDMRSYRQINPHTLAFSDKTKEKGVAISGRIVFSANGKSRTVYSTASSHGKTIKSVAVYEKQ